MPISREEKFKELYQKWEGYLKNNLGAHDMYHNTREVLRQKERIFKSIKVGENEMLALYNIRNISSHASSYIKIEESAIIVLQKIVNAFCRKAIDIAVPAREIFTAVPSDRLDSVIKKMNEQLYTHVPVVQAGEFLGIFSENILLKLVAEDRFANDLIINEIKGDLQARSGYDDYLFKSADTEFYEIYKLFQDYIDKGQRLGVIFLTKDGQVSGRILGLITAWDLNRN